VIPGPYFIKKKWFQPLVNSSIDCNVLPEENLPWNVSFLDQNQTIAFELQLKSANILGLTTNQIFLQLAIQFHRYNDAFSGFEKVLRIHSMVVGNKSLHREDIPNFYRLACQIASGTSPKSLPSLGTDNYLQSAQTPSWHLRNFWAFRTGTFV
jgi:hypothetical protein